MSQRFRASVRFYLESTGHWSRALAASTVLAILLGAALALTGPVGHVADGAGSWLDAARALLGQGRAGEGGLTESIAVSAANVAIESIGLNLWALVLLPLLFAKIGDGDEHREAAVDHLSNPELSEQLWLIDEQYYLEYRVRVAQVGQQRRAPGASGYWVEAGSYSEILSRMKRYAGPLGNKRVLEIGPGSGVFLLALRELGLIEAEGLEVDPELVALANEQGLAVVHGDFLSPPPAMLEKPYDVTFSHKVLDLPIVHERGYWTEDAHRIGIVTLQQLAKLTKQGGISVHQIDLTWPFTPADIEEAGFELLENSAYFLVMRRRADDSILE